MSTHASQGSGERESQKYEMTEHTTKSGQKFRIGRPVGSAAAEAAAGARDGSIAAAAATTTTTADGGSDDPPNAHGQLFAHIPVVWPPNQSADTEPDLRTRTGIIHRSIETGGVIWKQRLWFNTEQTYFYWFRDGTADEYGCNVYFTGWHWIDYNSGQPTINGVSGF